MIIMEFENQGIEKKLKWKRKQQKSSWCCNNIGKYKV